MERTQLFDLMGELKLRKRPPSTRSRRLPSSANMSRSALSATCSAPQRNVVLVGGTGTGKTHLAIAVARSCIRDGPLWRGGVR
jgi:superfamily II DNA or RNA helicase